MRLRRDFPRPIGLALLVALVMALVMALWAAHASAESTAPAETAGSAETEQQAGSRWTSTRFSELGFGDYLRQKWQAMTVVLKHRTRPDRVAVEARLELRLAPHPGSMTRMAALRVLINGVEVARLPMTELRAGGPRRDIPFDARLLGPHNEIGLVLEPHVSGPGDRPTGGGAGNPKGAPAGHQDSMPSSCVLPGTWSLILADSRLVVREAALPGHWKLDDFPLPFTDPVSEPHPHLSFVFPAPPSPSTLRAAFLLAARSALATPAELSFVVQIAALPLENAIVIGTAEELRRLGIPVEARAGVRLIPHPASTAGDTFLLVVSGDSQADLEEVALAFARRGADVPGPPPAAEESSASGTPAPLLPRGRLTRLSELFPGQSFVLPGRRDGSLTIRFRLPPGISFWPRDGLPLQLVYRQALERGVRSSKIVVTLNGKFVMTLQHPGMFRRLGPKKVQFRLPQELLRADNELTLYSEFEPGKDHCPAERLDAEAEADAEADAKEYTAIRGETAFDLRRAIPFVTLPDLARTVGEGFPFTGRRELGQTTIVPPVPITPGDASAILTLAANLARAGAGIGAEVQFAPPNRLLPGLDRDLIVVGTEANQPLVTAWRDRVPAHLDAHTFYLRHPGLLRPLRALLSGTDEDTVEPDEVRRHGGGLLMSFESPLRPGRTVLLVTALDPAGLVQATRWSEAATVLGHTRSDVALLMKEGGRSWPAGTSYGVGAPGRLQRVLSLLSAHPVVLLPLPLIGGAIIAYAVCIGAAARTRRRLSL